jgi:C4-dicarboxylate-specific signal transduction histidine kinase
MNLLMNALDAVATQPRERRRVRVSTRRHASDMLLEVADAGTGLPAGRQSQVFEPFYTTKREGTGMGMGLAIARSIVEAHSGRIGAANNEDGGATFCLSLPAGSEAPDAVRHPAPAPLTKVL